MTLNPTSPWHKKSYDTFLNDKLPQLLAARLPLAGYQVTSTSDQNCTTASAISLTVAIRNGNGEIEVEYQDIPYPNEKGIFQIADQPYIVIPLALDDHLDRAEIHCVGEQIYGEIEAQLGEAPEHIPWDAALLKVWLPLTKWITDFLSERGQILDTTNWLSEQRHLRAILIPNREKLITPGHFGRVCPFETPEGPNIGKVLRVAVGATIEAGKFAITDPSPVTSAPGSGLGVSVSMIPLMEHDDPNRLLMGANMMGQWVVPTEPEPALVQTGNEPNAPNFWCGRNLLTAFISWGADTYNDALVLSQSAATRLGFPHTLETGDKLSNRHGTKGVVARILPDDEMPHLSDGTPLELLYSFRGVPLRLNFGQIREALLGRIAQREGVPIIVPAYQAPSEAEIRSRLADHDLPPDGVETLTLGPDGPSLERPAMVGYVYWGKTAHLARFKIRAGRDVFAGEPRTHGLQYQGELEYQALRDAGALTVAEKVFHLQAASHPGDDSVPPKFAALQERLNAAGIKAEIEGDGLNFSFTPPDGKTLTLAQPVPHPWLLERELTEVGVFPDIPEYALLEDVNARLSRLLESQAPKSLAEGTAGQLEAAVHDYLGILLTPADLRFGNRVAFSGRAVIVPGGELRLDQVGLPEEMAWTFFGPQVAVDLKDKEAVDNRTLAATEVLDQIMAKAWIVINRAPSTSPTALLAFHPVRIAEPTVRIHPLVCRWLDADFDGDQVAVYLPLGEAAQLEAAEKLSVAGHLRRDPALIESLSPEKEITWGLGSLCLTPEGRAQVVQLTGVEIPSPEAVNTQVVVAEILAKLLTEHGLGRVLETLENLKDLGFEAVKKSGASVHPFLGNSLVVIPPPESDDPERWREYVAQYEEQIIAFENYSDHDLGVHAITMRTNSRPPQSHGLTWLMANRDPVWNADGKTVIIRNSSVSGLRQEEMDACVVRAREGLARVAQQWDLLDRSVPAGTDHTKFNVLARARRTQYPGVVFARAAAIGERDPLTDVDSRLFVGLPVK
jgi:hypothetical protein